MGTYICLLTMTDQGIKDIKKAFGIPRNKVGVIQGKKFSLGNVFTVGMVPGVRKSGAWSVNSPPRSKP